VSPALLLYREILLFGLLRRRLSSLLAGARILVLLLEAVDSTGRVYQLLAAGKERMAGGADFHADIALVRRTRLEDVAAGADDFDFVVSGVNTGLHDVTGIPFEIFSISQ